MGLSALLFSDVQRLSHQFMSFKLISDCQDDNFTREGRLSQTTMRFLQQVLVAVSERIEDWRAWIDHIIIHITI